MVASGLPCNKQGEKIHFLVFAKTADEIHQIYIRNATIINLAEICIKKEKRHENFYFCKNKVSANLCMLGINSVVEPEP